MQTEAYNLNYLHEESHWWFLARKEILLSVLAAAVEQRRLPPPPLQILDYGCGTGGLTRSLERFGSVLGVDESSEALSYCRERGLSQVQSIASPADLPDQAYDLVCSFDVLEHVEDDVALLRHWKRILRPNGLLLITVPAFPILWSGEDQVSRHVRRYRGNDLRKKVRSAGLDVVRMTHFNSILFPPIASVRLFNRFFRPWTLERSDVSPVSPLLNRILLRLFGWERRFLKTIDLPFGVSLLLLASPRNDSAPLPTEP